MLPTDHHVFVCIGNKPPMVGPSCQGNGSRELFERLQLGLMERDLGEKVRVTGCTCLGPCESGINLVVYPDAVAYTNVKPDDADELIEKHLIGGEVVERLRFVPPEE